MKTLKYYFYRMQFHCAPYLGLSFPTHVDIELSAKCNLRCVMCAYGDGSFDESRQGMMSWSRAILAVSQASRGGAKSIKFNFRGEPGLSPYLVECVYSAKTLGFIEIAINTNLLAFSQRRLKELCDAGLNLMIVSIDGATKKDYEKIRVNGDWNKLLDNLRYVVSLKKRPRIRLQMVVQKDNQETTDAFRRLFEPYSDEIVFQIERSDNSGKRKRCPQSWQRLIVGWDGNVFGCCNQWGTEYVLGQFPKRCLYVLWNSEKAKHLRKLAKHPDRGEPCKSCTIGSSYK